MATLPMAGIDASSPTLETETALARVPHAVAELVESRASIDLHPVDVYLASLGNENSRRTACDCLKRALALLGKPPEAFAQADWWLMGLRQAADLKRRLLENYSVQTTRLTLSMVRSVLHQSVLLGLMGPREYEIIKGCWKRVSGGSDQIAGRMLVKAEIARLRVACEVSGPFWGAMDAAILACGLGAGLRRDEIAQLDVDALSDDSKKLVVTGKGRKTRGIQLPGWAGGSLETWLAQRSRFPFDTRTMFVRRLPGGQADATSGLSKWQVWRRLRDVGERAGVSFTPHDLRRTFISMSLDHADLATVQQLAGHADPGTTVRYDRRPDRAKEAAAVKLDEELGAAWSGTATPSPPEDSHSSSPTSRSPSPAHEATRPAPARRSRPGRSPGS